MIKINNVYYMLAYVYKDLNKKDDKLYDKEEFDSISDLFATIIYNIIDKQIKKGLNKNYVPKTEAISNLKGKINITESIKKNTSIKHQMVCEFDEYVTDTYLNRIVKTASMYLIKSKKIESKERKNRLKKLLYFFNEVEEIKDIHNINWNSIRYDRNNSSYKFLIEICKLILNDLYISDSEGNLKLIEFKEDKLMANLYEKFIKAFYEREFKDLDTSSSEMDWNYDKIDYYGNLKNLPSMRTDIVLKDKNKDKTLIIDAKFYSTILNSYYDSETFNSNNLYQMYAYVNRENKVSNNVTGLLLYAKTEDESIGWNRFKIDGNNYIITELDLSKDFSTIEKKLKDIVGWFRGELTDDDLNG